MCCDIVVVSGLVYANNMIGYVCSRYTTSKLTHVNQAVREAPDSNCNMK